jgi:glycerophosphoryl diester phosphodiesterase
LKAISQRSNVNGSVSVSAHKGGCREASLPLCLEAYQEALAAGADYVEFDIRRTRDGELVVHHDYFAGRTDNAVPQLTYTELCRAAGHAVPRVGDVMKLIAGKARGHLDIKETGYEDEIISLALDILGAGNFVATTLEDDSVKHIKTRFPGVCTALSLGRSRRGISWFRLPLVRARELFPLRRIRACGADWVAVHESLARARVLKVAARCGLGAMVWTVNEDARIRRWLGDHRVTVLITDYPGRALRMRSDLQAAPLTPR